jgi:choline dehydrogenase-like flavoprotein
MHYVVGSGPSGVACAQALLDKGLSVTLLDAGIKLEASKTQLVQKLSATPPSGWDSESTAALKGGMAPASKGPLQKLLFGSDFPYRDAYTHVPASYEGVGLRPSFALGGLSNVWGAALMPYADSDLREWPISAAQLAPHYSAVLNITGISAREDNLNAAFPLYTKEFGQLNLSRQSRSLLEHMEKHETSLKKQGIHFGTARVAIRAQKPHSQSGCVHCGMCMYGCPYGYIYNSTSTVRELQRNNRFTYQPDTVIHRIVEHPHHVGIQARNRISGQETLIEANRVYLAAGTIPTTRLLLDSRGCYNRTLKIQDSQYFLIPLLLPKRARDVQKEALYALSQLFIEIFDDRISPNPVHLQVYSYNELIGAEMRKSLARFGLNFNCLARRLDQRMLIVQGFLHSNLSSSMNATLTAGTNGTASRLVLEPDINPSTRKSVGKVISKLLHNTLPLGALPLTPMLEIGEPGRSFHSGGSFPMRQQPGEFATDILGRPFGWKRVHAVDATVLPTIPANTITLSVMANAHRIATESANLS